MIFSLYTKLSKVKLNLIYDRLFLDVGVNYMSTEIKEFSSLTELFKYLDAQIDELRRKLGELLRIIEEVRIKAEQERKLKSLLSKVAGTSVESQAMVVELKNLKLLINPNAESEMSLLEQLAETINSKMMLLQSIRRDLEVLRGEDIIASIRVIVIDGIPKGVILKL